MAIGNNHDELARLRGQREQWRRERPDSGAPGWTGQETPLPSWQETVTELLATTAGVGFVFVAIIVLVKAFG